MPRPMTIAEKILAAHAGLDEVRPGQLVECGLDLVLANDITAPIAIKVFSELGADRRFRSRARLPAVPDHYAPNKDIKSAEQAKTMRDFARAQGVTHYWEVGCMGVEHALLPEQGVVGARRPHHRRRLPHLAPTVRLGAFATGVGSTDAGVGWPRAAPGSRCPRRIKFEIEGELKPPACAARTSSCTSSA